jgi:hypothetical protein
MGLDDPKNSVSEEDDMGAMIQEAVLSVLTK